MNQQINIQDHLLNEAKVNKNEITVYLMNGYKIKGKIIGFDNFIIVLDSEGKEMIIYKHAISTIVPSEILKIKE
ncbi:MAG TPA: RNA chaperone Hfq [Soehngenia sp.]|nr:RNA chaperone Hfq [Soehngenia sp.]